MHSQTDTTMDAAINCYFYNLGDSAVLSNGREQVPRLSYRPHCLMVQVLP